MIAVYWLIYFLLATNVFFSRAESRPNGVAGLFAVDHCLNVLPVLCSSVSTEDALIQLSTNECRNEMIDRVARYRFD